MPTTRRSILGLALLGAAQPLLYAMPATARNVAGSAAAGRSGADAATDRALAAIVADPACRLASLSVLALRAGRPLYQAQFGLRDIDAGLPVHADTLYRIASVSKLMTALGVMRLVEAGRLALDADVSQYLGFSLRNPHYPARPITLRTLMSHTASLRDDAGYSWPCATSLASIVVPGAPGYGSGAMWAGGADSAPSDPAIDLGPGAFFTYCNLGWGLVGTIMEAASGERFDLLMRRLLLAPLGIEGGYNPAAFDAATLARVATLYRKRTVDTEVWDSSGPWIAQADDVRRTPPRPPAGLDAYVPGRNATPFSPTGGLRISADGLGVVMRMLLAGGLHDGQRLLQRATLEQMFARQWTCGPAQRRATGGATNGATNNATNGATSGGLFLAWGLGNQQFPAGAGELIEGGRFDAVGHLGDAYGLRSMFVFDRRSGDGFIVLVGGSASDPEASHGRHTALAGFEERLLDALWERTRHA